MSNENINTAGAAIAEALAEYDQEIADATKRITDEVAKEAVDALKKSSPKLTGSYRKGWRKKQSYADKRTKRNTVYNDRLPANPLAGIWTRQQEWRQS